jgi:hypothetical protein
MSRVLWALLLSAAVSFCFMQEANAGGPQEKGKPLGTSEFISSGVNEKGETIYFLRYFEEGTWHLKEIIQHPNGWLDTLVKQDFTSFTAAENAHTVLEEKFREKTGALLQISLSGSGQPLQSEVRGAVLWPTTQAWSWEWEQKYAQWLLQNMNTEFYTKYKVATDCADVAYSARWIFARIHGLPAGNRLSGSNDLFTNESVREAWMKLPTAKEWYEDRRFLTALDYLLEYTYTHSLMRDSYPVAINPANFLPGVHHLNLHSTSGHTQLVHRVNVEDATAIPFYVIQSTTPRKVRPLFESLFWASEVPKKDGGGFLRIRWPVVTNGVYTLAPAEAMPGYSLEQYDPGFIREPGRGMNVEVMIRLKPDVDFQAIMKGGLDNLKAHLLARVSLVEEGYKNCSAGQCPPGSDGDEAWSTPSRDQKIKEIFSQLQMLSMMSGSLADIWRAELEKTALQLQDESYTLKALKYAWDETLYSSDPSQEPGVRWGLAPGFFRAHLEKELQALVEARLKKITSSEDILLKKRVTSAGNYCAVFSSSQCLKYTHELEHPVLWAGQSALLREWLERILWFNSDSQQTREIQWGAMGARAKVQKVDFLDHLIVTKEGIGALYTADDVLQIGSMGTQGIENQPLPAGLRWIAFDKTTLVGFAAGSGRLLRHDFKTGREVIDSVSFQSVKKARVITPTRILVFADEILWSLEAEGEAFVVRWQQALSAPPGQLKFNAVRGRVEAAYFLYDFDSSAIPKVLPLTQESAGALVAKSETYFVLYLRGTSTSPSALFKLHRGTGKLSPVPLPGDFVRNSDDFSQVLTRRVSPQAITFELLELDADLKVVKSKDLGSVVEVYDTSFMVNAEGAKALYDFSSGSLQIWPFLPDEVRVTRLPKSWLTLELQDGRRRIRSLDGRHIIYEGMNAFPAEGQSQPEYIVMNPGELESRILLAKAPRAPALMTGEYSGFDLGRDALGEKIIDVERGAVFYGPGGRRWIEFPASSESR